MEHHKGSYSETWRALYYAWCPRPVSKCSKRLREQWCLRCVGAGGREAVTPPCRPRTPATTQPAHRKRHPAQVLDVTAWSAAQTWQPQHLMCAQKHLVYLGMTAHTHTHSRTVDKHIRQQKLVNVIHSPSEVQGVSCETTLQAKNTPPLNRTDSSPVSLRQRHAALKPLRAVCSLKI